MGYREKLSPQTELEISAAVRAKIQSVEGAGAIFDEPVYFSSKQDFVDELQSRDPQFEETEDFEIRAAIIELLNFEDLDSGGAQCPDYALVYNVHLFHSYAEREASNSYRDFKSTYIRLRNKFLMSFKFPGLASVEHRPLQPSESILTDTESRFFPGVLGTYVDFTIRVEVAG